jgi:hypothetical protein
MPLRFLANEKTQPPPPGNGPTGEQEQTIEGRPPQPKPARWAVVAGVPVRPPRPTHTRIIRPLPPDSQQRSVLSLNSDPQVVREPFECGLDYIAEA